MRFIDRRLTILLASASLLAACATAPPVETATAPPPVDITVTVTDFPLLSCLSSAPRAFVPSALRVPPPMMRFRVVFR